MSTQQNPLTPYPRSELKAFHFELLFEPNPVTGEARGLAGTMMAPTLRAAHCQLGGMINTSPQPLVGLLLKEEPTQQLVIPANQMPFPGRG